MPWIVLAVVTVWSGVAWGWFAGVLLGLVTLQYVVIWHLARRAPGGTADPYRFARPLDDGGEWRRKQRGMVRQVASC